MVLGHGQGQVRARLRQTWDMSPQMFTVLTPPHLHTAPTGVPRCPQLAGLSGPVPFLQAQRLEVGSRPSPQGNISSLEEQISRTWVLS